MYQAPIVAALIGATWVWGHVGRALEGRGVKIPLFMHHYGFMYAMLLYLFHKAVQSQHQDVMVPTNWLDKETIEAYVSEVFSNQPSETTNMSTWRTECSLDGLDGLKWFSMLCPVWVFLTLVVCVYHTHLHINKIRYAPGGAGLLRNSPQHDQTLTVLVLPVVYGLMSYKSSQRMWQVMMNHVPGGRSSVPWEDGFVTYDERKEFLSEMYEANFMVGDIYETIALVTFGHLVMGVLKKKIDRMKAIFEQETKDRADGEQMNEYIEKLVASMRTLTVAGVQLFAMSCMLQGVYTLFITTMAFDFPGYPTPEVWQQYFGPEGMFQDETIKASAHNFFLGAGFIASFAAIGNIMIIEEDFEHLLKEFAPALKFWGTKILVSLAFLQSILISLFLAPRGWSVIQSNLFYSSALCLECLLIAIFHIKGWSAEEMWYGDYPTELPKNTMQQPLLPAESK